MLKIILIVEAIGKPDKRRHHRFVSFASVRLNGIVCFAKGKMHCFATLDKAELRRSIKRRQTASVFPVVVERHNTTQNDKGEKMKTTLSCRIIPETGKVSSGLGGRIRLKPDRICRITPLLWKRRRDKIGVFTVWIAQNAIVKKLLRKVNCYFTEDPYNEACEHEINLKKSFSNSKKTFDFDEQNRSRKNSLKI